ncbi:hypothetical protein D0859_11888 [Hortaea werneckii]|uniref:Alpha/beta hydrolase fold-3 domain-containing protein n=1 Tax=Hortaea werneckii TaxID=91943 RepID=A0A3M7IF00_HORWE|nr:hypothetical protein D0859_11888 [Hortaea werneckii]
MARSMEERAQMGTPAPELLAAIKERPFPDLSGGDANPSSVDMRNRRGAHLAKLRHLYPIPGPVPEVIESEHHVSVRDGSTRLVKIYTPAVKPVKGSPLIVMIHEGGWCMGDLTDEDLDCRMFARDLGAVCVNVDYRLAPEHPYPAGVNDCWDVLQWCAATASPGSDLLPCDPKLGFLVGGASAGGNLSAVMAQLSRDNSLSPPITGQYLCVPATLWVDAVPEKWRAEYTSRFNNDVDPVLRFSPDGGDVLMDSLKPDTKSPLFSPLLHPNLKGLAPAYFQVAGLDPLRDEGLLYERVLREENGVATKIDVYNGYGHMFWTNWPELPRSKEFVQDTLKGVKWLLNM